MLATRPAQSSLFKACPGTFYNILANLVNRSNHQGCLITQFKKAQITVLVKKQGFDSENPASYRPISNLKTISKVMERLVLTRITGQRTGIKLTSWFIVMVIKQTIILTTVTNYR